MAHKQACVLIVGDEPDILRLKQLIGDSWGAPGAGTGGSDAAPGVQAEDHPMAVTLDTGSAGSEAGKTMEMSVLLDSGKDQNDERQASAKEALGEFQLGGTSAELIYLTGELHPDFSNRRITLGGRAVIPQDMGTHSFYCPACGSIGPQAVDLEQAMQDQGLGRSVVLHLDLSRIGQRLGGIGSGLWGLLIGSGVSLRNLAADLWNSSNSTAFRSWRVSLRKLTRQGKAVGLAWFPKDGRRAKILPQFITRRWSLPMSLALRTRLAARLQICRNMKELYPNGGSAGKAPASQDLEQSPQPKLDEGRPGSGQPAARHRDPVGTAPVHPGTLHEPRREESPAAQSSFIGSKLEAFLQALLEAYSKVAAKGGDDPLLLAPVVPLADVYQSLHWSPNQPQAYSKKEFARDIYLLHRSGLDKTTSGVRVSFPISRGVPEKTFTTTDENGMEMRYFGIRFMKVAGSLGHPSPGLTPQNQPV